MDCVALCGGEREKTCECHRPSNEQSCERYRGLFLILREKPGRALPQKEKLYLRK